MERFSFSSALLHFVNTKGPGGFVWKWLLANAVIVGGATIIFLYFYFDALAPFLGMAATGAEPTPEEALSIMGPIFGMGILAMPVTMALMAMFETSALRRYVRNEGFSLKFGKEEWRTIGVYFLWIGTFILAFIIMVIAMIVLSAVTIVATAASPESAVVVAMIIQLLIYAPLVYFGIRLAPAAALTLRDGKVKFSSAFKVTKGRFWKLFGAYIIVYLAMYLVTSILQIAAFAILFGSALAASGDFSTVNVSDILESPVAFAGFGVILLAYVLQMALTQFIFMGIASRTVITDPDWDGNVSSTAEVFD